MNQYETLAKWIKESQNICILTGAGISTASNIPDFRSTGGIYNGLREEYLSKWFFNSKPKIFWEKYKEIFQIKLLGNYEPNEGHYFLSDLEKMNKKVTVLTQNVDGLHSAASSSNVVELHGTLKTATCPKCKTKYNLTHIMESNVPRCARQTSKGTCNFILRPNVVLFGDTLTEYKKAEAILDETDLFLVLGTSLKVNPVNYLPRHFSYVYNSRHGTEFRMAIINREPTEKDEEFPVVIHEEINEAIKKIKMRLEL